MSSPIPATPVVTESSTNEVPAQVEDTSKINKLAEKYKVKINGKEEEVTLEDLKRGYGLNKASWQRFEEASKKMKEAEDIKNIFSSKQIDALQKAGWTDEEIEDKAADYLIRRAQQKSMTPEQRAQAEREADYEKLKKEKIDREDAERTKAQRDLAEREAKLYQTSFLADIKKENEKTWLDLNNPVILSSIINDITVAAKNHNYDLSVADAIKRYEEKLNNMGPAKKEYLKKLLKTHIKDVDDNDIDAFLDKGAKGIRENSIAAIKRSEAPFRPPQKQVPVPPRIESTPIKRDEDYYRQEAKRYRDLRYNRLKTS